jgi:hypothetical protein
MKTVFGILFALIMLTGCSSPESVRKMEGKGTFAYFEAPFKTVFPIAVQACNTGDLRTRYVKPDEGFIFANSLARMESWGENVAIWVREKETNRTEVEVVSRHSGPRLFFHINWDDTILTNIAVALAVKEHE